MTNIAKRRLSWKKYYKKHKKEIKLRRQELRKNNVQKYRDRNKEFSRKHPDKIGYNNALARMKKKGLPMELSLKEFSSIMCKPCTYCGKQERMNSVDRIDSQKGYTEENTQPLCHTCNMMKLTMSHEDFLHHVSRIYEHNEMERP